MMTVTEADELLKERVEEARTTFDRNVALTMAILAVLLATDSLFGHRAHTEELLEQAQASDQWAYYQAKTIRRAIYDVGAELARVTHDTPPQASQSIVTTFRDRAARYEQESKAIEERAREFEHGRDRYRRLADRFDLAEIFLEVSIVMCSLAILTKRRSVWLASGAIGITGVLVALTALRLH
jgi:DNA repair exonuclease SbcCD ATPase subunit